MKKKILLIALPVIVIALIALIIGVLVQPKAGAPSYATLLPEGKSIAQLGGWTRVTPPGQAAAYSFSDTIDGVKVTVTQQALPDRFAGDVAENVRQVAASYNATTNFEVEATTVYIGTSSKGPQSVIFAKDELLILAVSEDEISTASWQRYISALK